MLFVCKKEMNREQIERFYTSKRWKRKREIILRRDRYQCQLSKRYGKTEAAEVVHHIFPVEGYPQYALASWNLISLSRARHNTLHDRTTNELTREGIDLMTRTAREQKIKL